MNDINYVLGPEPIEVVIQYPAPGRGIEPRSVGLEATVLPLNEPDKFGTGLFLTHSRPFRLLKSNVALQGIEPCPQE